MMQGLMIEEREIEGFGRIEVGGNGIVGGLELYAIIGIG